MVITPIDTSEDWSAHLVAAGELLEIAFADPEAIRQQPEALEIVLQALDREPRIYRSEYGLIKGLLVQILGTLQAPEAVDPLITLLNARDGRVRTDAAIALGQIQDPRAVQPLIRQVRRSRPPRQNLDPAWALRMAPLLGGYQTLQLSLSGSGSFGEAAIQALGQIGHADAIPTLEREITRKQRASAALALAQIDHADAVTRLQQLLLSENETVSGLAAQALSSIGAEMPLAPLLDLLDSSDPNQRLTAAL